MLTQTSRALARTAHTRAMEAKNAAAAAVYTADAAAAAVAGTTPGRVWLPATAFSRIEGAPALKAAAGLASWHLDPTADEAAGVTFAPIQSWASYEVDVYLIGTNSAGGNARIRAWLRDNNLANNNEVTEPLEEDFTGVTTIAPAADTIRVLGNVLGTIYAVDHLPRPLVIGRHATNALDTHASDIGLVGVLLRGSAT